MQICFLQQEIFTQHFIFLKKFTKHAVVSALSLNIRVIEAELGLIRTRHLRDPLLQRPDDKPSLHFTDVIVSIPLLLKANQRVLDVRDAHPRPFRQQRRSLVDIVDVVSEVEALECLSVD